MSESEDRGETREDKEKDDSENETERGTHARRSTRKKTSQSSDEEGADGWIRVKVITTRTVGRWQMRKGGDTPKTPDEKPRKKGTQ